MPRRRPLDEENQRAGIFAAGRQPLHHAQQREQHRRGDAQRRITRQEADQEGRDRHRRDREGQRCSAAEPVADMANDRPADRPHQIADREHAERRQQLRGVVLARKEVLPDRADKIAVDREIVPFERVADHAGDNDLAPARWLHSADSPCCRRVQPSGRLSLPSFRGLSLDGPPAKWQARVREMRFAWRAVKGPQSTTAPRSRSSCFTAERSTSRLRATVTGSPSNILFVASNASRNDAPCLRRHKVTPPLFMPLRQPLSTTTGPRDEDGSRDFAGAFTRRPTRSMNSDSVDTHQPPQYLTGDTI